MSAKDSRIPERCKQCKYFNTVYPHSFNCFGTSAYFSDLSMRPTDFCCKDVYDVYGLGFWEIWVQQCEMLNWFKWDDKLTKYDFEEEIK